MRILDRLIVKNFLALFSLFLLCAPPLFVLGDLAEHLDDYIDRGLSLQEVALSYVYLYPLFIQWLLPDRRTTRDRVYGALDDDASRDRGGEGRGISFHRLVAPLLLAGVMLTGVALALTEVVPRTNKISAQILRSETPGRSWRSDFVYRSEEGLSWQVNRLTASDGRMTDVVIERPRTNDADGLHVIAEGARFDEEEGLAAGPGLPPDAEQRQHGDGDRVRPPGDGGPRGTTGRTPRGTARAGGDDIRRDQSHGGDHPENRRERE